MSTELSRADQKADELELMALRRFLARISYKPGVTIDAELRGSIGQRVLMLHIRAELPDATGRKAGPILVNLWNKIPAGALESDVRFMRFLYRQLQAFEHHELHEWLKIDGRHYRRPKH